VFLRQTGEHLWVRSSPRESLPESPPYQKSKSASRRANRGLVRLIPFAFRQKAQTP
jgi:hypothetical protein